MNTADRHAQTRFLQERLLHHKLYRGHLDGLWGPLMIEAVGKAIDLLDQAQPAPPITPVELTPTVDCRLALELGFHEAVVRQAYRDGGGVWTWSVGLTSATGHSVERYIGRPQTMQHCLNIYVWALKRYAAQVDKVFKGFPLTSHQYAAAVSFHWNTGAIRRASWVTLLKEGNLVAAEANLKSWNKRGGTTDRGLVNRRAKEADLMFRGIWSGDGTITEYTALTPNSTPRWSSAVRIDVRAEMLAAFGASVEPVLDRASKPNSIPDEPTLSS